LATKAETLLKVQKDIPVNPQKSKRSQSRNLPSKAGKTDLPAVLFDLDGTLIDTNYQHVNAWSEALLNAGIEIPRWKIHRRIGMSGQSFVKELLREVDCKEKGLPLRILKRSMTKNSVLRSHTYNRCRARMIY
jgi:hypothetical protein